MGLCVREGHGLWFGLVCQAEEEVMRNGKKFSLESVTDRGPRAPSESDLVSERGLHGQPQVHGVPLGSPQVQARVWGPATVTAPSYLSWSLQTCGFYSCRLWLSWTLVFRSVLGWLLSGDAGSLSFNLTCLTNKTKWRLSPLGSNATSFNSHFALCYPVCSLPGRQPRCLCNGPGTSASPSAP